MPYSEPLDTTLQTTEERRFCFVVHALSRVHRGVMGVPSGRMGLIGQWRDGTDRTDVLPVCDLELEGVCKGQVVGVPMVPMDLLSDQQRAVERMVEAVALAGDVHAVGLGSLCAVVGGRGEELAGRLGVPVTNGGAATAWALLENVREVMNYRSGPVAIVGARSPVGQAVVSCLTADGVSVRVDHKRAARHSGAVACDGPEAAVAGCEIVVGAGPTGGTIPAASIIPGAVVVDVAIPGTLVGTPHSSVRVLAGEALSYPAHWRKGFWGWLYHVFSGYGPSQVFACLIEPLVLAVEGRTEPYSIGRSLDSSDVEAFGRAARGLGFEPRLAQGWAAFESKRLKRMD